MGEDAAPKTLTDMDHRLRELEKEVAFLKERGLSALEQSELLDNRGRSKKSWLLWGLLVIYLLAVSLGLVWLALKGPPAQPIPARHEELPQIEMPGPTNRGSGSKEGSSKEFVLPE